jgi:hypothetical protein
MKLILLLVLTLGFGHTRSQTNLVVEVNEGVSLLTTIQYLSGQLHNSTSSDYKTTLKTYFLPYRNHPAVKELFLLDNIYPDLTELGFGFFNFPDIKMHPLPDSLSWYKYIPKPVLENYLKKCMQFYKQTKFHSFHLSQKKYYAGWAEKFTSDIKRPVAIFNSTFGNRDSLNWYICLEPLNDWGAHTYTQKTNPLFKKYITYQQGYFGDVDSAGKMVFKANVYDVIWHEGTHAITDNILKRYRTEINALSVLMKEDVALKKQNISDWPHYFNELVARSVSLALFKKYLKQVSYEQLLKIETGRGFIHVKDVSDVIVNSFLKEGSVIAFEDIFPEIFEMLREKYKIK